MEIEAKIKMLNTKKLNTKKKTKTATIDIQPKPALTIVEGSMRPLGATLKGLKLTQTGELLYTNSDEVLARDIMPTTANVNAGNLERAWATLVALRLEDLEPGEEDEGEGDKPDEGEVDPSKVKEMLKADFGDFKTWCRDPQFLRAINLDPAIAVCWFIDTMLAANGDLGTD